MSGLSPSPPVSGGGYIGDTVLNVAGLLTQPAGLPEGYITRVLTNGQLYQYDGIDQTQASSWEWLSVATSLTETQRSLLTEMETGQTNADSDGDQRFYTWDGLSWLERPGVPGPAGPEGPQGDPGPAGGGVVDIGTWSVAGSTGTFNLSQAPANPEAVRFVMQSGSTYTGTAAADGQVTIAGTVATIDSDDYGIVNGEKVIAIYE